MSEEQQISTIELFCLYSYYSSGYKKLQTLNTFCWDDMLILQWF